MTTDTDRILLDLYIRCFFFDFLPGFVAIMDACQYQDLDAAIRLTRETIPTVRSESLRAQLQEWLDEYQELAA